MADSNYAGASDFLGIPSSYDDVPGGYQPLIGYGYPGMTPSAMRGRGAAGRMAVPGGEQPIYGAPRYTEESALGIYQMSAGQVWKWQVRLANAGLLSSIRPGDASSSFNAYRSAMTEANRMGIGLKEYLAKRTDSNALVNRGAGSSSGGGGGSSYSSSSSSSSNTTSSSVSLTGKGQAESLLRQAMTQQLGRAPTNKEVAGFKRALNTQERKNPTITKTQSNQTTSTQTSTKGTHTTSSSSTSGTSKSVTKQSDIDAGEEALDYARSDRFRSERVMHQDAGYYNAIADLLGM